MNLLVTVLCHTLMVKFVTSDLDVTNLIYIQGKPVDYFFSIDAPSKFMYPDECDQYCINTESCKTFAWNSQTSECRVYDFDLDPANFVKSDKQQFWMVRNFRTARKQKGVNAYSLTELNNYENIEGEELKTTSKTTSATLSLTTRHVINMHSGSELD